MSLIIIAACISPVPDQQSLYLVKQHFVICNEPTLKVVCVSVYMSRATDKHTILMLKGNNCLLLYYMSVLLLFFVMVWLVGHWMKLI